MNLKKILKYSMISVVGLFLCLSLVAVAAPSENASSNVATKNKNFIDTIQETIGDAVEDIQYNLFGGNNKIETTETEEDNKEKNDEAKEKEAKEAKEKEQKKEGEENQEQIQVEKHIKIKINSPKTGKELQEQIRIEGEATDVEYVELYLTQQNNGPEMFIGEAKVESEKWEFDWDSTKMPNGEYYIIVKDGSTNTKNDDQVKLKIKNAIDEIGETTTPSQNQRAQVLEEVARRIKEGNVKIDLEANKLTDEGEKIIEQTITEEILDFVEEIEEISMEIEKEAKEIIEKKEIKERAKEIKEIAKEQGKEKALERAQEIVDLYKTDKEALIERIKIATQQGEDVGVFFEEENVEISDKIGKEVLKQESKQIVEQIQEMVRILEQKKFEGSVPSIDVVLDSDGDGVSDLTEAIYGTDINNPDSDGDGYLDGVEIQNAYDPLNAEASEKITFEEPKTTGEVMADIYEVTEVDNESVDNVVTKIEQQRPVFKGRGLPNSFVTLYIYSSLPVVVTTKTDANGNWSYVLSKPLETGEHEVYVAITDNTGKIVAKSEPKPFFVFEARVVSAIEFEESVAIEKAVDAQEATDVMLRPYAYVTILVVLIGLIISIIVVIRKGKETDKNIIKEIKK
ncbi:MAG: Ig-like domain-containing protein [bacterium]